MKPLDWRKHASATDGDPDDEELKQTPRDVVGVIGFDPLQKPKLNPVPASTLSAHDRRCARLQRIYAKAIAVVLDDFERSALAGLRGRYSRVNASAAVSAAAGEAPTTPASVKIKVSLGDFTKQFVEAMSAAAEEAVDASYQSSLRELEADAHETPQGIIHDFVVARENKIKDCPKEIYDAIAAELKAGADAGETTQELAERVQGKFGDISDGRAYVIARTETQCAYGVAADAAMRRAGFSLKRWVTQDDERVRPTHEQAEDDGSIPVDEDFSNGLSFPGDPDGPADEVIGCRCRLVAVAGDEEEGPEEGEED